MFINMSKRTQIPLGFNVFELFLARRSHLQNELFPGMLIVVEGSHSCVVAL